MPELPEVETIARAIAPAVAGRTIVAVRRLDRRIAALASGEGRGTRGKKGSGLSKARAAGLLAGRRIARIRRRGKALILSLHPAGALVFRLGMTGRVHLGATDAPLRGAHLHAAFSLSGGIDLLYTDSRRFGRVLVDPHDPHPDLGLAPDPFSPDFTWQGLAQRGGRSRRAVKEVLMDQAVVSGIGNIYAAEILHRARVSPLRPALDLGRAEWKRMASAAVRVLDAAIEAGGSTVRDFSAPGGEAGAYQESHRVYGREGEGCRRCRTRIVKLRQGGRSTYYCPRCQR